MDALGSAASGSLSMDPAVQPVNAAAERAERIVRGRLLAICRAAKCYPGIGTRSIEPVAPL